MSPPGPPAHTSNPPTAPCGDLVNPFPSLSGETLVVPIIGDPIAQVKSPTASPARSPPAGATPLSCRCSRRRRPRRADHRAEHVRQRRRDHRDGPAQIRARRALRDAHRAGRFLGSANVARRSPDGSWHGDHVDGAAYVAASGPPAGPGRRARPAGRRRRAGSRSRWPCWRPASPSWPCTTPTRPADALIARLRSASGPGHRRVPRPDRIRPRRPRHPDGHARR